MLVFACSCRVQAAVLDLPRQAGHLTEPSANAPAVPKSDAEELYLLFLLLLQLLVSNGKAQRFGSIHMQRPVPGPAQACSAGHPTTAIALLQGQQHSQSSSSYSSTKQ
jgi:hypothetical protein